MTEASALFTGTTGSLPDSLFALFDEVACTAEELDM
jgi:hypothetical protein